jgi:hypothetical protein
VRRTRRAARSAVWRVRAELRGNEARSDKQNAGFPTL